MSEGASSGCCSASKGYQGVLYKISMRQKAGNLTECDVVLDADKGKLVFTNKKSRNVSKISLSHTVVRKTYEGEVASLTDDCELNKVLRANGVLSMKCWFVVEHKGSKYYLVAKDETEAEKWMDAIRRTASTQKDSPLSSTESDPEVDDRFDIFSRSFNFGPDSPATFNLRESMCLFMPGPCMENGFLPDPVFYVDDELRFSIKCEVETTQMVGNASMHDVHTKPSFLDAMLFVTKFRVIIKRPSIRNPMHNFHIWDIDMVRVDSSRCYVSFVVRNGDSTTTVITVWVPAPSTVANALYKSFSVFSGPRHWPQLAGIPKWSYDFVPPSDPAEPKDPAIVYRAQCSYVGKRANPTFLRYLQSLYRSWDRHLDLTCVTSFDDDIQTTLGMLEHDQFFLGVSTARCQKKDAFAVASRVLRKNQTLTLLSLRDVSTPEDNKQIAEFCSSLRYAFSFSALTWIDLSGNILKEASAKSFAGVLESFTHRMTHIDLGNCQIGSKGMCAIFEAMITNLAASVFLDYLDVSGNKCEESACGLLDCWLNKVRENLNPDGDGPKGLSTLKMASCRASFSSMRNLANVTFLKEFDMSDNKLGESSCKVLCLLLGNVKTLRMVDCNVKKDLHARLVHAFLDSHKTMSDFSLEISCISQAKSDKNPTPTISTSNLPPELLERDTTIKLQRVSLSNIYIPCVQMDKMCRTLSTAPSLSSVTLQDVTPECFSVPGSSDVWGNALAKLVRTSQTLLSLTLHSIPPEVINTLMKQMPANAGTLQHLDVGMCNLGNTGAFSVAEALSRMNTLHVIELDDNNIHIEGIHAISCSIVNAPNLTQVNMERDIAREIAFLNAKSPFLAAQCLSFANGIAVELANNAQKSKPSFSAEKTKRLSVIELSGRKGWNSMLPREIRLISPSAESLPIADISRSLEPRRKRKLTLRKP